MSAPHDATSDTERQKNQGIGRRGFLTGLGAGAASTVALRPVESLAAVTPESAGLVPSDRFGRIFDLPPFAEATDRVRAALREMGRPGGLMDANDPLEEGPKALVLDPLLSRNNRNNGFHTAGTHFFAQFMDHDITFDHTSPLGVPTPPQETPNGRTPNFDLDSIYGGGPTQNPIYYQTDDPKKFRVESGGLFEDFPRGSDGRAIIPDPRNEDNLMVTGIHLAFLLFHNNMVDKLRDEGVPEDQTFAEARRLTTWHYQYLVVNEFLPLFIGGPLVTSIRTYGRKFYRPQNPFIPVEFQSGPYRFGHSMVRPSYAANLLGDNGGPFFAFVFKPGETGENDPEDLRGGYRAPRRYIGWEIFFNFRDGTVKPNKRIDTTISTPLFQLPPVALAPATGGPEALPQRNLLRQLTWNLPSGQRIAQAMGVPVLGPSEFPELREFGVGFESSTPLWYYSLKEAELVRDGTMLGPSGGRIVGEVIMGLLELDPSSYLSADPGWQPTVPSGAGHSDKFRMVDFLTFAGVDPASRREQL